MVAVGRSFRGGRRAVGLCRGNTCLIGNESIIVGSPRTTSTIGTGAKGAIAPRSTGGRAVTCKVLGDRGASNGVRGLRVGFSGLASRSVAFINVVRATETSNLRGFPVPCMLAGYRGDLYTINKAVGRSSRVFKLAYTGGCNKVCIPPRRTIVRRFTERVLTNNKGVVLKSSSRAHCKTLKAVTVKRNNPRLMGRLLGGACSVSVPKIINVCLANAPRGNIKPRSVTLTVVNRMFTGKFMGGGIVRFIKPNMSGLDISCHVNISIVAARAAYLSSV